jgi:hypothetical protein
MPRQLLLILTFCFVSALAYGQGVQKGTVYEIKSHTVVAGLRVENSTNGKVTATDKAGKFSIPAKGGDVLFFKSAFYLPDTVVVTDLRGRDVFVTAKQNELKEVKVTNIEIKKPASGYVDPEFHGQTMIYQRNPPSAANPKGDPKGGVILRLHYWNKDEKDKKKQAEFLENEQTRDEIARVFKADNIAKYVPLKGPELDNFILLYIPSVKVYTAPEFNLTNYLSASYKSYLELPPDKRNAGQLIK